MLSQYICTYTNKPYGWCIIKSFIHLSMQPLSNTEYFFILSKLLDPQINETDDALSAFSLYKNKKNHHFKHEFHRVPTRYYSGMPMMNLLI